MKRVGTLVVFAVLVCLPAAAQNTDLESLAGLTFNFQNPGARSLGMGGAFLGLADDATAAEANPAGLTILRSPEISLELRNFRIDTPVTAGGEFPNFTIEEFTGHSNTAEVSFASFVFPRDRWAVAAYYHRPLSIRSDVNMVYEFDALNFPFIRELPLWFIARGDPVGSGGPIDREECIRLNDEDFGACTGYELNPYLTGVDISQKTFGIAGAYSFGPVSVGAGVRYQLFDQAAALFRYIHQGTVQSAQLTEILVQATELDEEGNAQTESAMTFNLGLKWSVRDDLSVGATYKHGAEYPTAVFQRFAAEGQVFDQAFDTTFHVPDTAGIGVAYRPMPVLTILADAVFVRYSNLTDDFKSAFPEIDIIEQPYKIDDALEYHLGAEYFFPGRTSVAIRGGWWLEPAHGLDYVGPITCDDERFAESDRVLCSANRMRSEVVFTGGEDQHHFTVGVGLAWPKFQIDAAYDTSDAFKVGSISAVYRF